MTDIFKLIYPQEALSPQEADAILQQVFAAGGVNPNTIPLETLTSYSNYRKDRYALQRRLLVVILALFMLLPVLFMYPKVSINPVGPETVSDKRQYDITVDSPLPITNVTATIDGRKIPVYESDYNKFTTRISENGLLKIVVTLVNNQQTTQVIGVENIDEEPPVFTRYYVEDHKLHIFFKDDGTGIDFKNIKAVDLNGTALFPVSYDEATGLVVFDYPQDAINIYIPDKAENMLHLSVSLKK